MAENRFESIRARYALLDQPLFNPAAPGANISDFANIMRRRRELISTIRSVLKGWNIEYNWGASSNWWQTVPVNTYNDINNWLTPERENMLRSVPIERRSFLANFIERFNDIKNQFGGLLMWPLLAPFKRGMKKMLSNRGYSTSGTTEQIGKRFFAAIVKKEGFGDNVDKNSTDKDIDNATSQIPFGDIVQAILKFFKGISSFLDKHPEDASAADMIDKDAANAEGLINADINSQNAGMDLGGIGKLLLVAVILYMIYRGLFPKGS